MVYIKSSFEEIAVALVCLFIAAVKANPAPCDSVTCQNGGSCVDSTSVTSPFSINVGYCCVCPPGFSGTDCASEDLAFGCTVCSTLPSACLCDPFAPTPVNDDNCGASACSGGNPCSGGAGLCFQFGSDKCCACPPGFTGEGCNTVDVGNDGICLVCEDGTDIPDTTLQPGCVCDIDPQNVDWTNWEEDDFEDLEWEEGRSTCSENGGGFDTKSLKNLFGI